MTLKITFTASELANKLNGTLYGENCHIQNVGTVLNGTAGQVGFYADGKYHHQLADSRLSLLLTATVEKDFRGSQIVVEDVRKSWRILTEAFEEERLAASRSVGIHSSAIIAETAVIGEGVNIGAGAVIEDDVTLGAHVTVSAQAFIGRGVVIGTNTSIGAGARILHGTIIGERCNILANAVIGERGFGNSFEDGRWLALPQLGGVRIGNDVEVGAGTMIDRGAVGDTIIHDGVKLDNLIQVAHNVEIGEHTAIAGCCVIAGSVKFGKYCIVGGATVFAGHIEICDGAHFTGHSSISKSITEPGMYSAAFPAMPTRQWNRFVAKLRILGKDK